MFGMSQDIFLLVDALVAILGLILLITRWRVHPFIALTLAAGFLGLTSGMPVDKVMKSFQDGFGGVLGFVGIVLGLGTMLGKMMAESGGADRIAQCTRSRPKASISVRAMRSAPSAASACIGR